jgi:hypothetical protein
MLYESKIVISGDVAFRFGIFRFLRDDELD